MNKNIFQGKSCILFIILFFLLCSHAQAQEEWIQVAYQGFNNPKNDYAWSMATFKDKLYVATLNIQEGGEIWRTDNEDSSNWAKVYNALAFTDLGMRCFYADQDQVLYAGTMSLGGGQILRTTDGITWTKVTQKGLGNIQNKSIRCIIRFGDYLYAGTGYNEAMLYRSADGMNWTKVDVSKSISSTKVTDQDTGAEINNNIMIGEFEVFNGRLYAFTWTKDADLFRQNINYIMENIFEVDVFSLRKHNKLPARDGRFQMNKPTSPGAFEVWRSSDGIKWECVVGKEDSNGCGMGFNKIGGNLDNDVVTAVSVFQGQLYLGTENANGQTAIWRTSDGITWEKFIDFYMDLGERFNFYVWRMIPFERRLFIGTMNMGSSQVPGVTGGQVWVYDLDDTPDTIIKNLVHDGFGGDTITVGDIRMPKNYGIRCFGILDETLFAGTATMLSLIVPVPDQKFLITIAGKDVGCEVFKMELKTILKNNNTIAH